MADYILHMCGKCGPLTSIEDVYINKTIRKANGLYKTYCKVCYSKVRYKGASRLSDSYIRGLLRLRKADVPQALVELKRTQMELKRLVKEKENQQENFETELEQVELEAWIRTQFTKNNSTL